jgi:NAD-reducing hydrogenase large subunit
MARDGVRLRQFGQQIIERLAGKRIHPAWVAPGGVTEPLARETRDAIVAELPGVLAIARRTLDWFKPKLEEFREEIRSFSNFPSLFLALIDEQGRLEHYHGRIRIIDATGKPVADDLDPLRFNDYLGESVEPDSYLKSPYYKPLGYPDGIYRVGPLARLNLADSCGTPLADQEWAEFRELHRGAALSSFYYHYARLIEILYGLERIEQLLSNDAILNKHVRAFAEPNNFEGVGVSEAPRGTLWHHYRIDGQGLITYANLVIATGHNNLAMNRGILQAAKHFVHGDRLTEGALNRVEAVIRCYDPCLSCSTHSLGEMSLDVALVGAGGEVLDRRQR